MVARSKTEYKKYVDWYRRLADDVAYRRELKELQKRHVAMRTILVGLQLVLESSHDLSNAGQLPGKK